MELVFSPQTFDTLMYITFLFLKQHFHLRGHILYSIGGLREFTNNLNKSQYMESNCQCFKNAEVDSASKVLYFSSCSLHVGLIRE